MLYNAKQLGTQVLASQCLAALYYIHLIPKLYKMTKPPIVTNVTIVYDVKASEGKRV